MRVPPSKPDDLNKDGANLRVWKDSRAKLRTLAALRGKQLAETFDAIVHEALQSEYDALDAEGDSPP